MEHLNTIFGETDEHHGFLRMTDGDFETEEDGVQILDSFLDSCDSIRQYRELSGEIIHPRIGVKQTSVRADKIVLPMKKMVDAGWNFGSFIIECKAPNKKIGPIVCQCIDYQNAAYKLPDNKITVVPEFAFIWHCRTLYNDIASVAANNRIGSVWKSKDRIRFSVSSTVLFEITECGELIFKHNPVSGFKAGSR